MDRTRLPWGGSGGKLWASACTPPEWEAGRTCKATSVSADVPIPDQPDDRQIRELAQIPAVEVITRASVMLMSAAAEKLGLAEDGDQFKDLDEARRLIEAYAGLLGAAQADLGVHRQPLRDGLKALQEAFREASTFPDEPGQGPGEKSGF
ncbi:MAG: hypothetical protein QOE71_3916 [Pseudonocardiales bacterium]|jgi:hypothetical protein|nr:hypothetical protein [Pseudonocardiales bacterium]